MTTEIWKTCGKCAAFGTNSKGPPAHVPGCEEPHRVLDSTTVLNVLTAANELRPPPARASGCGRVYVSISGDRETVNAVAKACKKLGLIFQRKAYYGLRNAIYIGYDNADGRALAKGEAFASVLTAAGISAYSEACSD